GGGCALIDGEYLHFVARVFNPCLTARWAHYGTGWKPVLHFSSSLSKSFHGNPIMPEDVRLASRNRVFIRNPRGFHWHVHTGLHEGAGAGFAKTAVGHVLFNGDDRAALTGRTHDRIGVQWLDRVHTKHAAVQTAGFERLGGEQRVDDRFAGGEEGD